MEMHRIAIPLASTMRARSRERYWDLNTSQLGISFTRRHPEIVICQIEFGVAPDGGRPWREPHPPLLAQKVLGGWGRCKVNQGQTMMPISTYLQAKISG